MVKALRTTATLEPRGPAGAFLLDDDQVAEVGDGQKAFPVRVTVNGTTLGLRLTRMRGENMVGFSKAARGEAGVEIGSSYELEIALDDGERVTEVPDDLAAALAADDARDRFDALSYTHRKEFVRWMNDAKKGATRAQRVAATVEMVVNGQTR